MYRLTGESPKFEAGNRPLNLLKEPEVINLCLDPSVEPTQDLRVVTDWKKHTQVWEDLETRAAKVSQGMLLTVDTIDGVHMLRVPNSVARDMQKVYDECQHQIKLGRMSGPITVMILRASGWSNLPPFQWFEVRPSPLMYVPPNKEGA